MRPFFQIAAVFAILISPCVLANSASAQDGKIYVKVSDNRDFSGEAVELQELKVTTGFGEISIPLEKVDGIKMNAGNDGKAMIAFKNGDMVSGKVALDHIKLKTDWGEAHINTDKIETVTSSEYGRFYSDNTSGTTMWRFSKSPPVPAGQLNSRN